MEIIELVIKPDEDEPGAAEVLVEGSLDGRARQFLLDSGAARSNVLLDEQTSQYPSVATAESSGLFSSSQYDVIEIQSLLLGSHEIRDFRLHRQQQESAHAQNLIGMDFLKHHRCFFDFESARLILNPPAALTEGLHLHALTMDQRDHPYISVDLGSMNAQTTWDTGAGVTVVDQAFIEKNAELFTADKPSHGTDSSGTTRETPMYRMAALVIGNQKFGSHRVAAVDLSHLNAKVERPMDMILGYTTLQQATWYFDFPGRQWAIKESLQPI